MSILWKPDPFPVASYGNKPFRRKEIPRQREDEAMGHRYRIFIFALLVVFTMTGGCSMNMSKQAVRQEKPVAAPPGEGWTLGFRAVDKELLPQDPPFSVTDEYRGRWLTLFEVTASPVSAGNLPESKP
jgi:hypothetical protein